MFIFIALGPDCDCGVRHALPASGCLLSLSLPSHTCLWVFGSAASGLSVLVLGFDFLGEVSWLGFLVWFLFILHQPLEGIIIISLSELKFCHSGASSDSSFYTVSKKSG